jgi:RNA polymerase sigma-70 factor, ECF subfamily
MDPADILALPRATFEAEYLEDVSLRRLVLEHYDQEQIPLQRYLTFLGLDGDTARELVQESFLKLHEHLLAGGDRRNLRAWLYRVAHNLARNAQSAARASKTDPLPDVLSSAAASIEDELLERERLQRLRNAVEQLSTAQKECLALRAQGLKYREIADVLSISVSTVGENIQRGLERLKDLV